MAEWTNIQDMFVDIARFAKANPKHAFLWADDHNTATYGVVAFREHIEDEQLQEWRITLAAVRDTRFEHFRPFAEAFRTAAGKRQLLQAIVESARKPNPEGRRSRYELLMQDDDGLD